jgi:AcrR family transcriptional regulator
VDEIAAQTTLGRDGHDGRRIIRVVLVGTPLYAEPAEASPPLAYLNKGTTLEVLSDGGAFLHVRMHDTTVGYVRGSCAVTAQQEARGRLVQAAIALFATKGYHNTKLVDIAREAGYSRNIVHYYFSSKEELGYAAIDEWMRLFVGQGAASRLKTVKHPIDRLIEMLDGIPGVQRLETIGSSAPGLGHGMAAVHEGFRKRLGEDLMAIVDAIEVMVSKGVADGLIADAVDPGQLAHLFATVCMGIRHTKLLLDQEVIWVDTRRWMKDYLNSLRT